MSLLAASSYDPPTVVSKVTSATLAMTAMDTTNLRLGFLVPPTGKVLVRLRGVTHGSSGIPQIFLGVMNGAAVIHRMAATTLGYNGSDSAAFNPVEVLFVVTGLTPNASLTWDAAYGVEKAVTSTGIKYGGPNDATANNAFGAFEFEIWTA